MVFRREIGFNGPTRFEGTGSKLQQNEFWRGTGFAQGKLKGQCTVCHGSGKSSGRVN